MYKGKGKGVKGKKSKNCGRFVKKSSGMSNERDDPGTPDELPDPHLNQILPEVLPEQTGFSPSFTISSGSSSSERSYGSQAISPDIPDELPEKPQEKPPQLNQNTLIKPKKEKTRKSTERRAVKRKAGDLEEHMLHGPFNFKAHRAPGVKKEKTSSNLRDELITVVMQAGRKPAKVAKTNSVEIIEEDIKPVVLAAPDIPEVLVLSPIPPAPPVLAAPTPAPPAAPALIAAPAAISNKEIDDLVGNLCEMFQETDPSYIRLRAEDLVGKPAALDRFTMELIQDPNPPVNWRQIYSIPLHQVQTPPPPPPPPPQLFIQQRDIKPSTPPVHTDDMEEIHLPGISKIKNEIGSRAQTPVQSGSWMRTPSEGGSRSQTPSEGGSRSQTPSEGGSRAQTPVQDRSRNPTPSEDLGEVEVDPQEELEKEMMTGMRSLFPDLCPAWIQDQIYQIVRSEIKDIQELHRLFQTKVEAIFSLPAEERKSLPTYKDWEKKQREMKELEKWSGQMTVSDMLDLFQDPVAYFTDPSREMKDEGYKQQCVVALKEAFRYHSNADVEKALRQGKGLFALTYKILKNRPNSRKTKRSDHEVRHVAGPPCIHLLKEKKFVELEEMIKVELKNREERRLEMIEEARTAGILVECSCCYSDECLDEDMISCNNNHMFCKECVSRGASVAIGDGKTIIECLGMCSEEISWQELQRALTPNVLSKLLQKRQAAEVATAGLEGIVTCPFCPYMTIMDDVNDKILVCKNPDCGRESCRLCKEPNHVPLRCEEVESRDEETQRKKIEEKLSQAMIRECHKCKTKYFKEEGCNKMTCPKKGCGAKMCYLCKEPVQGYEHFYGQGGTPGKEKKCPLWSDSKSLHEKEIALAAQEAREELAENNITLRDSVNPTKGIPDPTTIKMKDPFPVMV
ncbi:uncharacterized protein LOC111715163 isoform X4 [Eurytemora carolleeae]|uniref:uncharacterized protein LOC111715163 isoform X4 n=1 Tax=Eurytemora carolleeae TaxID=1294199 RepID=UPI000C77D40B|nr:uncharacterized protein LOC111715163 isoform X4 [Eurytemora carolleeae]|eukprot:XP_023346206.1 uncharacterized protein LOC111715163 isoform X4 [Eurytemora affinis]